MRRPLIVALHGVGSSARDLATALAPLEPVADIVALDGCEPFDGGGHARQWFSVAGVTATDRPLRVAGALPSLLRRLDRLASSRGVARRDLVLLGFSQGAIMTLAAVAQGRHQARAIAIARRLAAPVVDRGTGRVLLVHDADDTVMAPALSDDDAVRLQTAGHRVDIAVTNGIGIGPALLDAIADWLMLTDSDQPTPQLIEG